MMMEGRAAAAAASAVLDNDDLLGEILLRLAFPTSLVRAALVCKRWLRLVSAPAFLRHFRHLHPPHLLGFYVTTHKNPPRFVPMPQPPELASVFRHASFELDMMGSDMIGIDYCRNGLLIIITSRRCHGALATYQTSVRCPLYPRRHISFLPPVPKTSINGGLTCYRCDILTNGGGDDGQSYFCLVIRSKEQHSVLDVYVLEKDTWAMYSSAVTEIRKIDLLLPRSLILDGMIYNLALVGGTYKLVSLDVSSARLSLVNLPEEVVELLRTDLSLENDDSEVHLIYVRGSQLRIWLYMVDNDDGTLNSWLLVDTICLLRICAANHMMPTSIFEDVDDSELLVYAVGVDSGLFFLEKDEVLYLFDIKRKTAKMVFAATQEDKRLYEFIPFMMVWPPKFPVMTDEGCDPKIMTSQQETLMPTRDSRF
uniref:Uncharacterized protein n=1 Tax=Avena sativa TaxID=4498 RepID=A0ACD6AB89_AVESA